MPQLGETVLEGTILKWLKKEGDRVEEDEPLFEISTDKVDTEVPSPAAGIVTKILVPEGETVSVGTDLAEVNGGDGAETPSPAAGAAQITGSGDVPAPAPAAPSRSAEPKTDAEGQVLSPIVRRLVKEHGVDLSQVTPTGAGGRVTKKDVEKYLAERGPATPGGPVSGPAPGAKGREEVVPVSHIRKQIAEHMHRSLQVSARAWNMVEVEMENVVRVREQAKTSFREREGFGLTYMPFLSRAVCAALLEFPHVNAELRGEELVLRKYVNLGVAVSYDEGLIVPVVKDADAMSLVELGRSIHDLATRARAKQLKPDEVHGGTFTITNPGPFGSEMSVPIINQPESAILAFDAVVKRPVVVEDAIAAHHTVFLSMSWDHRVIDGAMASQFLSKIREHLQTWDFAEDLGS